MSLSPLSPLPSSSNSTKFSPLQTSLRERNIHFPPTFFTTPPKELRQGHRLSVRGLSFSADGRKLATCSADKLVRIWVPERSIDYRASTELRGHTESVDQLAWDPTNPEVLATASADRSVRIWDTRSGGKEGGVKVVNTPGGNINIAYHPNGQFIAVGDKSDTVSVVDVRQGAVVHTVCTRKAGEFGENTVRSTDEINELAYSPDGSLLLLSSGSGSVHIHSTSHSYKRVHSHPTHSANVFCLQWDPLGRYIATASSDSMIGLWDTREWFCHKMIPSLTFPARSIGFSFDGEFIAAAGEDSFISINATNSPAGVEDQVGKINLAQGSMINTLAWHPSRYVLAYAGDEERVGDLGVVRVVNL